MRSALSIPTALLAALVITVAVVLLFLDWDELKGLAAGRASEATGREYGIYGDIDVDLSIAPRIRIAGVRMENADWGSTPQMVEIEQVELRIRLSELLKCRLVLPELVLVRPVVALEKREDGAANWDLGGSPRD